MSGPGGDDDDDAPFDPDAVTELPIGDELDLHPFRPAEVADLVAEYLTAAQAQGLAQVRIVHGKGTGALRRTVHAALERHPAVKRYALGTEWSGSWGATMVELHPLHEDPGAGGPPARS